MRTCVVVSAVIVLAVAASPRRADAGELIGCVKANGSLQIVATAADCKDTVVLLSTPSGPAPSGSVQEGFSHSFESCTDPGIVVVELPVTLTAPSIVLAFGQAIPQRYDTTGFAKNVTVAELRSNGVVVASRQGTSVTMLGGQAVADDSTVNGPLLDETSRAIYTAAAGSYTLQLSLKFTAGLCGQTIITPGNGQLSFVTQPGS